MKPLPHKKRQVSRPYNQDFAISTAPDTPGEHSDVFLRRTVFIWVFYVSLLAEEVADCSCAVMHHRA